MANEAQLLERIEKLEAKVRGDAAEAARVDEANRAANAAYLTPDVERRHVLKAILNSNLLHPKAREEFEAEYAEIGAKLEKAAAKAAAK